MDVLKSSSKTSHKEGIQITVTLLLKIKHTLFHTIHIVCSPLSLIQYYFHSTINLLVYN